MVNDRNLRFGSFVITAIGFLDAVYLTWVKLTNRVAFCGGSGGCESVSSSPYSTIGGIPISILGMGAYFVVLVLLYLEPRGDFWKQNGPLMVFGISLAGVIYSAYLTYLELEVIHAICPYCVLSAIVMVILFLLSITRLIQGQAETNPI